MQITIVQREIEAAITAYMLRKLNVPTNSTVSIDLQATRGPEGYRAVVSIDTQDDDLAYAQSIMAQASTARSAEARAKVQTPLVPAASAEACNTTIPAAQQEASEPEPVIDSTSVVMDPEPETPFEADPQPEPEAIQVEAQAEIHEEADESVAAEPKASAEPVQEEAPRASARSLFNKARKPAETV